jgi:uncharacterized oligopeptide transporter (OPT) family protein
LHSAIVDSNRRLQVLEPIMDDTTKEPESEIKYTPEPGEAQLTWRAVIVGSLMGSIVACTNIYVGLKIGWSFGASIISAVLSYSLFAAFNSRLSVLETNIAQAAGSTAGYMSSSSGLLAAVPAMMLLGYQVSGISIVLWGTVVTILGIFFAVPLRRQYVEIEKLRFPDGTATAETILAMASDGGDATTKSRVLVISAVLAGLFTLASHWYEHLMEPPIHEWYAVGALTTAAYWQFTVSLGPSLVGAGMIMSSRVVWSLVAGAITGWGILGPLSQRMGWAPGTEIMRDFATGPRGWILWCGVAILVSESLMSLALSWRTFVKTLTTRAALGDDATVDPELVPNSWWIGGIALASPVLMVVAWYYFGIPWYLTAVAIPLSAILASVGVRSVGETNVNPVGGLGKVTQLVYGALAPGQMSTNLMAAAITAGGASQAADMMQDLKTGYLLGASPRKLLIAQFGGVLAGIIFVVPVFETLTRAWGIGSEKLPAPAAFAWKAMAEVLADGFGALPPYSAIAATIAAVFGASLPLLRRIPSVKPFVPSGLAFGIGFITLPSHAFSMFYGLLMLYSWQFFDSKSAEKLSFAVASGFIAGEGLMGIVNAILTLSGIGP